MKKNITVTLDPEVALWVRVEAARRERSVSSFLSVLLKERMDTELGYAQTQRAFLERAPQPLRAPCNPLPGRDALHDRSGPPR